MKTKPQTTVIEPITEFSQIPAVVYVRVSLARMDQARQVNDITLYCKRNDYIITELFEEKISGLKDEKIELNKCLKYIDKHKIEYLIISELSRLGRTKEVLNIIDTLNKKKVCLISLKEGVKTLNDDKSVNFTGNLVISVLSGINTFEVETLKYRVRSGLKTSVNKGHAGGSSFLPYGYKKEEKVLIPDANESEVIKKIFDLYIQGNGTQKIARYLNEQNIPNRNQKIKDAGTNIKDIKYRCKWVDGTVYCILINSIYIGKRNFKGEILDQPQLRILTDETFNTVQTMLKNHTTKQNINRKYDYYVANDKLICGCCGKHYHMIIKYDKTGKLKDNRYVCISRRMYEDCNNIGIGIEKLNKLIQNVILIRFDDVFVNGINTDESKDNINQKETEIESLNKEFRTLELKEKKYLDLYIDEMIDKSLYQTYFKTITNDKKKLTSNINKLTNEIADLKKTIKNISDVQKIFKEFNSGKELNKEIVNKIIEKVVITKVETDKELFLQSDKVVKVDIYIAGTVFPTYISQYSNNFVLDNNFVLPLDLKIDKFNGGMIFNKR